MKVANARNFPSRVDLAASSIAGLKHRIDDWPRKAVKNMAAPKRLFIGTPAAARV
jgi:hypothetical protein